MAALSLRGYSSCTGPRCPLSSTSTRTRTSLCQHFAYLARAASRIWAIFNGTVVFKDLPPPTSDEQRPPPRRWSRPELDCRQPCQLLLDSLQPGIIHLLEFAHFKYAVVIVNADSAWSCTRRLVSLAQPTYYSVGVNIRRDPAYSTLGRR